MGLGKNIRVIRTAFGISQNELAARSGVDNRTISALELRDSVRTAVGKQLADALGVPLELLSASEQEVKEFVKLGVRLLPGKRPAAAAAPVQQVNLENNPEFPSIRWAHVKASAGITGFAIDYDKHTPNQAPIVFSQSWFDRNGYRPERLFAMVVHGNSMVPSLFEGDTIVINMDSNKPRDGLAFVVLYEGETTVKRLTRDIGQWWLVSDNVDQRRYPRKLCDENTTIIGEVVYKQSQRI